MSRLGSGWEVGARLQLNESALELVSTIAHTCGLSDVVVRRVSFDGRVSSCCTCTSSGRFFNDALVPPTSARPNQRLGFYTAAFRGHLTNALFVATHRARNGRMHVSARVE